MPARTRKPTQRRSGKTAGQKVGRAMKQPKPAKLRSSGSGRKAAGRKQAVPMGAPEGRKSGPRSSEKRPTR
jgi:hypothetical protein